MKSAQTLCELLIFIICMCILLFCFKSFFLVAIIGVLSSCTCSFCMSFSESQGAVTCSTAISGISVRNSGSELFFNSVDFHRRCTTVLKNRFVPEHFSISAPSIQFQTRFLFINLYLCTIRFKHVYHQARALLGFIMHCFITIMKFHPCNQS